MHNYEPLSTRQAADVLGLSVRRVQQLIDAGDLPGKKLPGLTGSYVLDRRDVETYRDSREKTASEAGA